MGILIGALTADSPILKLNQKSQTDEENNNNNIFTIYIAINLSFLLAQTNLTIEGTVVNNTDQGTWYGVNIERNMPTTLYTGITPLHLLILQLINCKQEMRKSFLQTIILKEK